MNNHHNKKDKIVAKKSLGQHFLHSKDILKDIVEAGDIEKGETVLEIGSGTGNLTQELLLAGAKVVAIEIDKTLAEKMAARFDSEIKSGDLVIQQLNILDVKLDDLPQISGGYKVVANIPYYITGAILKKFLSAENQPKNAVLLIQKEVATRIIAKDKKESLLSISVKAYGEPKILRTVKKGSFSPPPSVDSAILKIENISKKNFEKIPEDIFFNILKTGFSKKRKFLIKNLEGVADKKALEKTFVYLNIDKKIRSEDLELEQWLHLARFLK